MHLDAPSMETQMHEGTSNPAGLQAFQGTSAPVNSQRGSQLPANDGSHSLPIDVEAIDDDILIISSSSRFPQVCLWFYSYSNLYQYEMYGV